MNKFWYRCCVDAAPIARNDEFVARYVGTTGDRAAAVRLFHARAISTDLAQFITNQGEQ